QQLSELDATAVRVARLARGCCRQRGETYCKERIGHELVKLRPERRQVFRIELIDVQGAVNRATEAEIVAPSSEVRERHGKAERQLTLNVGRVLLYARRTFVLINVVDRSTNAGQRSQTVTCWLLQPGRERIIERDR